LKTPEVTIEIDSGIHFAQGTLGLWPIHPAQPAPAHKPRYCISPIVVLQQFERHILWISISPANETLTPCHPPSRQSSRKSFGCRAKTAAIWSDTDEGTTV
jgi:hypothetical protein